MFRIATNILIARLLSLLFLFLKILGKNISINFCGFFFQIIGPKNKIK